MYRLWLHVWYVRQTNGSKEQFAIIKRHKRRHDPRLYHNELELARYLKEDDIANVTGNIIIEPFNNIKLDSDNPLILLQGSLLTGGLVKSIDLADKRDILPGIMNPGVSSIPTLDQIKVSCREAFRNMFYANKTDEDKKRFLSDYSLVHYMNKLLFPIHIRGEYTIIDYINLYRNKYSLSEIAKDLRYGYSPMRSLTKFFQAIGIVDIRNANKITKANVKNAMKKWTREEENTLIEYWNMGEQIDKLSVKFRRSPCSIYNKISKLAREGRVELRHKKEEDK